MSLSKLFNDNYKYLNVVAKRITRCKDVSMSLDLLSETYVGIEERQSQGRISIPEDNDGFIKLFCQWMKNYFVWPNSKFNKLYKSKENLIIDNDSKYNDNPSFWNIDGKFCNSFADLIIDEDALHDIELQVEGTNDFTKELIEISSSLGKLKTLKYIELVEFKRTLPTYEGLLFELYFEKELSTREIADMYSDEIHKINYQSINKMVNSIKTKINNYQWKQ